jgi:hypothetical protein
MFLKTIQNRRFLVDKIRVDNDPAILLKTLSEKYGFPATKTTQVRFEPGTPWTNGQEVRMTFKTATTCGGVKLEPYTRIEFTLHIADDPWESGEVILPTPFGKTQIWEYLQMLHSIPDISQFQIIAGRQEITKNDKWPAGKIDAIPHTFPVTWRIEKPQETDGFVEVIQEKMTQLVTVTEAWELLHNQVPGLFEDANLNFRGKLKPYLTINAEIVRRDVRCAVEFEVIKKGTIKYIHEDIPNMATWAEIHAHFMSIDERIPPFECYVNEEKRTHMDQTLLSFRLNIDVEVPDTTRGFGGAAGEVSRGGFLLPPTIFPPAR